MIQTRSHALVHQSRCYGLKASSRDTGQMVHYYKRVVKGQRVHERVRLGMRSRLKVRLGFRVKVWPRVEFSKTIQC